ncbi:hypothetical protein OG339_12845 [Streptosporangium sp. NBC_01495]|uniref:hypothetical protein n=1 Tax=Streptosporangium sp. NBC_01495 TaxID=2903899 RepID=UPI002E33161F|nr:hypothetical protein [Streptosporangium sp. NBC_01495]
MMDILRKSRLGLMLAAIVVVFSVTIPATATATTINAPLSWHSGFFVKNICYEDARSFSQGALKRHGYRTVYNPPNAVLGSNGTTIVEVSYAPAQTSYRPGTIAKVHFTVTAVSNTSSLAEIARNRVRESIVRQGYFDYC